MIGERSKVMVYCSGRYEVLKVGNLMSADRDCDLLSNRILVKFGESLDIRGAQ